MQSQKQLFKTKAVVTSVSLENLMGEGSITNLSFLNISGQHSCRRGWGRWSLALQHFTALSGRRFKASESCSVFPHVQVVTYSLVRHTLLGAHLSAHDLSLDDKSKKLQYILYWLSASKASDTACYCLIIQCAPYEKLTPRLSVLILSTDFHPWPLSNKSPCCQSAAWVMQRWVG